MDQEAGKSKNKTENLEEEIRRLRRENQLLREQFRNFYTNRSTVDVPDDLKELFQSAQRTVQRYFLELSADPSRARITIEDERYVLVRASSLSYQFFMKIKDLYADRGEEQAFRIGRNFLFDVAHVLGAADAKNFHTRMDLKEPIARMSAGPVHFAFTGWASVKIHPDSRPVPNADFYLHYDHPYSFEAEAWLKEGKRPPFPVCIMNAGYSSGWCEESFGLPLTAVEVSCKARGDSQCRFVMAPPDKVQEYLSESFKKEEDGLNDIPLFFQRKETEEKLRAALEEKSTLLKELHHRVKNNLQIISSLISMQAHFLREKKDLDFLKDLQDRIKAIGLVHERLHHAEDVEQVVLADYIEGLVNGIHQGFSGSDIKLELELSEDLGKLHIDKAISLGIIMNEIVSNSFKYAFPDKQGWIRVRGRRTHNFISLELSDDGIGFSDEQEHRGESLGMELIDVLGEQLEANIRRVNDGGTSYYITFPL